MTLGTKTLSSSYELKILDLISLETTVGAYAIRLPDISSWEMFCTDGALTPFYVDASFTTNRNKLLMTSTEELVVATSPRWPPPKKSYG